MAGLNFVLAQKRSNSLAFSLLLEAGGRGFGVVRGCGCPSSAPISGSDAPIAYADGLPGGPRRAYVEPAPAPLPAPLWTGFYIGAHLGGGWADVDWSNMVGYATAERLSHSPNGWVGGAQLGYNFQFSPNWVAGIEVSWSGASLSDSQFLSFRS